MNNIDKTLVITLPDGSKEEVVTLLTFKFNDNNKEYVIYTKNETDENGNVTIYISNVVRTEGKVALTTIADDSEWSRIKDVLRDLSKVD